MYRKFIIIFIAFTGLLTSACTTSEQTQVEIKSAWIREAPPNASAMAGYMIIINHTEHDTDLVTAESDDFKVIEFHRSVEKNGAYRMVRHKILTIPAHDKLELKPGDFHLMLISPSRELREGDTIAIKFTFSNQSMSVIDIPVEKAVYE